MHKINYTCTSKTFSSTCNILAHLSLPGHTLTLKLRYKQVFKMKRRNEMVQVLIRLIIFFLKYYFENYHLLTVKIPCPLAAN